MTLDPRDADPFRAEGTDDEPEPPIVVDLAIFGGVMVIGLVLLMLWWAGHPR